MLSINFSVPIFIFILPGSYVLCCMDLGFVVLVLHL